MIEIVMDQQVTAEVSANADHAASPMPDEIAAECARIRESWSEHVLRRRLVRPSERRVTIQVAKMPRHVWPFRTDS